MLFNYVDMINALGICFPCLIVDEALWLVDFTSDIQALFTQIDNIDCLQENDEEFDMSTLFDLILEKVSDAVHSVMCLYNYSCC